MSNEQVEPQPQKLNINNVESEKVEKVKATEKISDGNSI